MKTEPIATSPPEYTSRVMDALKEIDKELIRAKRMYPEPFNSQHEAIAVIREEYLELERECFKKEQNYDYSAQRKEAKQLAAMAIRLMVELT